MVIQNVSVLLKMTTADVFVYDCCAFYEIPFVYVYPEIVVLLLISKNYTVLSRSLHDIWKVVWLALRVCSHIADKQKCC